MSRSTIEREARLALLGPTDFHGAKPSAQRHARRLAQKQKARDREQDPIRYADRDGKFTFPHTKGDRK